MLGEGLGRGSNSQALKQMQGQPGVDTTLVNSNKRHRAHWLVLARRLLAWVGKMGKELATKARRPGFNLQNLKVERENFTKLSSDPHTPYHTHKQ